ncbi:MAG TPA: electron transfer flavoprotein beta subunit/FixA family protein [Firmicutes bacterium]|nr:electron transfer flavoprotein beta subunit/FixA family protein [Bacillota bacterium]
MKEDGTINRSVLPAIFNPEDLNALEMALEIKDRAPKTKITAMTMGPPSAAEILRQCLYRGVDDVYLLSDIKFAGSDTWATAYTLGAAIKKLVPDVNLIFAGRQAIDGDTAQVGPQVAEKSGVNQVTYVEEVLKLEPDALIVKRLIEGGIEEAKVALPALLTVMDTANRPRPPEVRRMMKYKNAVSRLDFDKVLKTHLEYKDEKALESAMKKKKLLIPVVCADELEVDLRKLGLFGSPTKVKKIENVVLKKEETIELTPDSQGAEKLISDLRRAKILG